MFFSDVGQKLLAERVHIVSSSTNNFADVANKFFLLGSIVGNAVSTGSFLMAFTYYAETFWMEKSLKFGIVLIT